MFRPCVCKGLYFNKIQCFCFDEQRLRSHEQVDMPVLFFIDPDFSQDVRMDGVNEIVLAYTFFKTDTEEEMTQQLPEKI